MALLLTRFEWKRRRNGFSNLTLTRTQRLRGPTSARAQRTWGRPIRITVTSASAGVKADVTVMRTGLTQRL
jgi:hypothetical protein